MKKQNIGIHLFIYLLAVLLTGCTSPIQEYIDRGKIILEENQLDGEIRMVYGKRYSDYDVYNMIVSSDEFASITDKEKVVVLNKLDNIYVPDTKILVMEEVNSQGHTFSLNYDGVLERDGEEFPPKPTSIPFVMPTGDFEMSWDTYDSEYNTLGGILTIRRQGSNYTMKLVMRDGSSAVYKLYVISDGNEIRLTENPGNDFGDYMYISSTGYLYFCDNQGVIYTVPLLD
jgi:hypothetical protein